MRGGVFAAIQLFSRQLVEDYDYPKHRIQTRPQYRLTDSKSNNKFPVDIAVFRSSEKRESELRLVVDCTQKDRSHGRAQLEIYLTHLLGESFGVWFNGDERLYLRRFKNSTGEFIVEEIPNIPKFNQNFEEIGIYKKSDLKPTHNLKIVFKSIHNHLVANTIGSTRDIVLAQQLIHLIFCKIHDEKYTPLNEMLRFRIGINEDPNVVKKRILDLFNEVKRDSKNVMGTEDQISLDTKSLLFTIGELQNYSLLQSERDAISDAFETFIGTALKGGLGQFFTPRNVVKMIVDILHPTENDKIIDPACGTGGFLIESLKQVCEKIEEKGKSLGWDSGEVRAQINDFVSKNFRGIDKDHFVSQVAKSYTILVSKGVPKIFCEDSLENPKNWKGETKIELGTFDIVMTNPPFGSKKNKVEGKEKLEQFELAYQWKKDSINPVGKSKIKKRESSQILFIERCFQLLKNGGRMAIVLPDGNLNNEIDWYVRSWLLQNVKIIAVIDLPVETFLPHTATNTAILILQKIEKDQLSQNYPIFFAGAEYCGHDSNGFEIKEDDIPKIASKFDEWKSKNQIEF